jgi:TPR repeat protein
MLRDLADRGRPTAQFILAVFLAQGIFLDKDESRARQLLDNSASSGHPLARIAQDELARDPAQSLVSVLDPVALVSQFRKAQVQPRLT